MSGIERGTGTCDSCGQKGMVALFEDRFERSYTLCGECWPKHIKKCPTCGGTGEIRTSGIGPLGKPAGY
jgi:hypothetical protein